jgi:hypothetical protein
MDTNRLTQLRTDAELKRDLWPDMRRRLDERTLRVSLIDWALLAAAAAWLIAQPAGVLALLYHL